MEELGTFLSSLGPFFGVLLMVLGIGGGIVLLLIAIPPLARRRTT